VGFARAVGQVGGDLRDRPEATDCFGFSVTARSVAALQVCCRCVQMVADLIEHSPLGSGTTVQPPPQLAEVGLDRVIGHAITAFIPAT
jgi:hypothetical protein